MTLVTTPSLKKLPLKNVLIWRGGNSFVITIPSDYIKNGILNPNLMYDIDLLIKRETKIKERFTEHDEPDESN